jgi:hypothetical protein
VGVVSVERTPTVPSGDRVAVFATVTGGFVIGSEPEEQFLNRILVKRRRKLVLTPCLFATANAQTKSA